MGQCSDGLRLMGQCSDLVRENLRWLLGCWQNQSLRGLLLSRRRVGLLWRCVGLLRRHVRGVGSSRKKRGLLLHLPRWLLPWGLALARRSPCIAVSASTTVPPAEHPTMRLPPHVTTTGVSVRASVLPSRIRATILLPRRLTTVPPRLLPVLPSR